MFLGTGWCLAWVCISVAATTAAPIYSGLALAQSVPPGTGGTPMYSVATYDQSVEFYLARTVTMVQYRGELDYGLNKDPGREIADLKEFERRWSNESQAFAVMEPSMYEKLLGDGLPMRVLGRTASELMAARQ